MEPAVHIGAEPGLIGTATVTGAMPARKRFTGRVIIVIGGTPERFATVQLAADRPRRRAISRPLKPYCEQWKIIMRSTALR